MSAVFEKIYPPKLIPGDEVRVITPSKSLSTISHSIREIANRRLESLGFKVTFAKNVEERDEFNSSSIESRLSDLHDAFADKKVKAVFAAVGGYNSNQLLKYIDWNILKSNPKIFIGYSDITALQNAIFTKTGLVTYSGPAWSSFGQKMYFGYTQDYFKKCLMSDRVIDVAHAIYWSDDPWRKDQDDRHLIENMGWLIINEGIAFGTILGANLCTLNLLQGTEYFPNLDGSILFLEDDDDGSKNENFDRDLQSLIHQPSFCGVKGLVIGRFQKTTNITDERLIKLIKSKFELKDIPVIANVDFGHTSPIITFPIGGRCKY